jgi:hypothetical protein
MSPGVDVFLQCPALKNVFFEMRVDHVADRDHARQLADRKSANQANQANQGTVYLNGFQGDESGDSLLKWLSARLLAFQRSSGL